MRLFAALFLIPLILIPAYAEVQEGSTDKNALDVRITYDSIEPDTQTRIEVDFVNPTTKKVQEHIDYTASISKDGSVVFGPTTLSHTSLGSIKLPFDSSHGEGTYTMELGVEGILFQPIPEERVSFDIVVGDEQPTVQPKPGNGGCLIATAAFASELAPQVQELRELRDGTVIRTDSGAAFMSGFNQIYYSFSPAVADLQRESPAFNEAVRIALVPMLSSLSLLSGVQIDSEQEMLGYGVSVILLNVAAYAGVPALGILGLRRAWKARAGGRQDSFSRDS